MISKKEIQVFGERHRVLLRANEFICLRPHPALREYISNYNITFPTKELMPDGFTAIPCGCATLSIEADNKRLFVSLDGPAVKPYMYGSQVNQLKVIITIEFKPAGLYAFTGISQSEFVGEPLSFEAVNPKLSKMLSDALEKAASVAELVSSLDSLLLEKMLVSGHPQLMLALQDVLASAGNIAVKKLSEGIHYSERQLNRMFRQYVGVSAKSFSRIIRINRAVRLLKKSKSLTLVSDVMGFHDLSHFIRDFRSVCGITPQAYRNNMSDFYINTKKF